MLLLPELDVACEDLLAQLRVKDPERAEVPPMAAVLRSLLADLQQQAAIYEAAHGRTVNVFLAKSAVYEAREILDWICAAGEDVPLSRIRERLERGLRSVLKGTMSLEQTNALS